MIRFDRFSLLILVRVLLIVATCIAFAFLFARFNFLFSQIILALFILLEAFELIWFSRRLIRELTKFLTAIQFGDFSVNFQMDRLGKDFDSLSDAFVSMIRAYQEMKIEKEAQFQLLQIVIDRISAGIIVYTDGGKILLMNSAAGILLNTGKVSKWNFVAEKAVHFTDEVDSMTISGRKLVEIADSGEEKQLSVAVHFLTIREESCRVVTFYDIRSEIEQKEIEAWHKLIRILTHEIMNSVTPLGSLTDTILMLLEENGHQKPLRNISEQQITDIRKSVTTIKNRSEGILTFVEDYRKLTNIPHPEMKSIRVRELFERVTTLMRSALVTEKIELSVHIDPVELRVEGDPELLDQVLINLMTNSIHACRGKDQAVIKLEAWEDENGPRIQVEDNGQGIPPDRMNRIFIPFYSTREGGSGIGLSFSKHVIHLHHGRIRVRSEPHKSTSFILEFPKPVIK